MSAADFAEDKGIFSDAGDEGVGRGLSELEIGKERGRGLVGVECDVEGFDGGVIDAEDGEEALGVVNEVAGEFDGVGHAGRRGCGAGELRDGDFDDDGFSDVAFEDGFVGVGGEADDVAGEGGEIGGLGGEDGACGGAAHASDDEGHGFGDGVAEGVEEVAEPAVGAAEEIGLEGAVDLLLAVQEFEFVEAMDGAGEADHGGEFIVIDEGGGFDEVAAGDAGLIEMEFDTLGEDPEIAPGGGAGFGEEADVEFVE